MRSPTEIRNFLNTVKSYCTSRHNQEISSMTLQNDYSMKVYNYTISTDSTGNRTVSNSGTDTLYAWDLLTERANFITTSENHYETCLETINSAISSYISKDKSALATKIADFIKEWYFYHDFTFCNCENDRDLGIPEYSPKTFDDWSNDWVRLILNNCFDLRNITNVSAETIYKNFVIIKIYENNSNGNGNSKSEKGRYFANELLGWSYENGLVNKSGWLSQIASKRDQEMSNFSKAISDMENSYLWFNDFNSSLINYFENRGNSTMMDDNVSFTYTDTYDVIVQTIDGNRTETRSGQNPTITYTDMFKQLAKQIYYPELYGMFVIIRCLELYNKNDFANSSIPISTYGDGKVYIPSYFKEEFVNYCKSTDGSF